MGRFEERLWSDLAELADGSLGAVAPTPIPAPRGRPRRRLPRLRLLAAGLAVCVALGAAGSSLFGPSGRSGDLAAVECSLPGHGTYNGPLSVPNPLEACAVMWQRLYQRQAPPLVAWSYGGRGVVIVTPLHAPAPEPGAQRLPAGWTVNAALVELTDQTEDITTGFTAHTCLTARSAIALAEGFLRSDSLHWTVTLDYWRERNDNAYYSSNPDPAWGPGACLNLAPPAGIESERRRIELHLSPSRPEAPAAIGAAAGARLQALERSVNARLLRTGACATPARAADAWNAAARAAATPFADAEPLPPTNSPSACARVFVHVLGGGSVDVVAADYP